MHINQSDCKKINISTVSLRIIPMFSLILFAISTVASDDTYDFSKNFGGPWAAIKGFSTPSPLLWNMSTLTPGEIERDSATLYSKKIGDVCKKHTDCKVGYSMCHPQLKKCSCLEDFIATAGVCKALLYSCPSTKGKSLTPLLLKPNEIRNCRMKNSSKDQSNCSSRSDFCFFYSNSVNRNGEKIGHCCPRPSNQTYSPGGFVAMCPIVASNKSNSTKPCSCYAANGDSRCTGDYDWCIRFRGLAGVKNESKLSGLRSRSACCLKPCMHDPYVNVDGFCYDLKDEGQPCEIDLHCKGYPDFSCVSNQTSGNHQRSCQSNRMKGGLKKSTKSILL